MQEADRLESLSAMVSGTILKVLFCFVLMHTQFSPTAKLGLVSYSGGMLRWPSHMAMCLDGLLSPVLLKTQAKIQRDKESWPVPGEMV